MLTANQEAVVINTLFFHYGILDAYFVAGKLFVVNRGDIVGVEKLLGTLNFTFSYQCVEDDVGYYA